MSELEKTLAKTEQGEVVIYQTEDGDTKIDVRFVDETVWLTQAQLVELYQSSKANISEHIKHIFKRENLKRMQLFGNSELLPQMEKNTSQHIIISI